MSRCVACSTPLSSKELTRKYSHWKECIRPEDQYIGLCTSCCKKSGIQSWVDNQDLADDDAPADPNSYLLDSEIDFNGDDDES